MMDVTRNGMGRACARLAVLSVCAMTLVACTPPAEEGPGQSPRVKELLPGGGVSLVPAPLPTAYCDVTVEGAGVLDLETEYLPNVVRCENGGANLEALKAQAIAARSVAYYEMGTDGSICDSQSCQVYSCGGSAEAIHIQAVEETSGMYLKYGDILTYGFYVAGDPNVSSPSCVGAPGGGPTETWVTYNEGNAGTDVDQTALGSVHAPTDGAYGQNRGCMSQWSARCLENDNGYDAFDILRFFYGDDIEIVQASGECVMEVDPPDDSGGTDAPADEGDGGGSTGPAVDDGGDPDDGGDEAADDGAEVDDGDGDGGDAPSEEDGGDNGGGGADDGGAPDDGADDGGDEGGGTAVPGSLPQGFGEDVYGDGDCACRGGAPAGPGAWLALLTLVGLVRRRR